MSTTVTVLRCLLLSFHSLVLFVQAMMLSVMHLQNQCATKSEYAALRPWQTGSMFTALLASSYSYDKDFKHTCLLQEQRHKCTVQVRLHKIHLFHVDNTAAPNEAYAYMISSCSFQLTCKSRARKRKRQQYKDTCWQNDQTSGST